MSRHNQRRRDNWEEEDGKREKRKQCSSTKILKMTVSDNDFIPLFVVENDMFAQKMLEWLETQVTADTYRPVEVDEHILRSLRQEEVFIVDYSHLCPSMPRKFYKNMVPDMAITSCERCCKFFIQDEYEFAYLEKNCCPFCRNVEQNKGVKQVVSSLAELST